MIDLIKLARTYVLGYSRAGRTHWDGCEREHIECLIQRLADETDRLSAENATLKAERDSFCMGYRMRCDVETKTLRAEIERLQARVVELESILAEKDETIDRMQGLLETCDKATAELERDAARYRWLRERMTMRDLRAAMPTQWAPGMEPGIDHAIDAAMEEKP